MRVSAMPSNETLPAGEVVFHMKAPEVLIFWYQHICIKSELHLRDFWWISQVSTSIGKYARLRRSSSGLRLHVRSWRHPRKPQPTYVPPTRTHDFMR